MYACTFNLGWIYSGDFLIFMSQLHTGYVLMSNCHHHFPSQLFMKQKPHCADKLKIYDVHYYAFSSPLPSSLFLSTIVN